MDRIVSNVNDDIIVSLPVSSAVAVANGGPVLPITWKGMLDSIRQCQPADLWLMISPELYATFWNLSLYDISFPKER